MTRERIEQLLYAMGEACENNPFHSLVKNLQSVGEEDWQWVAPGGVRSIHGIVEHVAGNKFVYDSQVFGDRSITWDKPGVLPADDKPASMIEWLRAGQKGWRDSIAALEDDEELGKNRMAPWGTEANTRWLIVNMTQHDLYHSGEINYIRALRQGNDG